MIPKLWRYVLIIGLVIGLVILVANLWNGLWSFLPWSAESRLQRSESAREYAESNASARTLESQGNAEQIQRVETFHRQEVVLRDLTEQSINEARSAPDATDRPSPEYADALRAADERLCHLYAGCSTPEADRP